MSLQLDSEQRIIKFGSLKPALPVGWYVIQLDSGHYMAINEDESCQSCITVNRYRARRWAFTLAEGQSADGAKP